MNNYNENSAKFCAGCGHPIVLMMLNKVLEKLDLQDKAVLRLDIGCSLLAWNYLPVNTFQTHHGRVTPTVMGFKRAKKDSVAIGYTGDGGAYAIGLQSLLWAARRDEPVFVMVVNNSVYAMTGGQTAPTTLKNQKTSTNPKGVEEKPLLGVELLKEVASGKAYLARTVANDPKQMQEYIEKAIKTTQSGHFALVEFLSMCPTNWKTKGKDTFDVLDNMKEVFKLGEIYAK